MVHRNMEIKAAATCQECGYNLPFHTPVCTRAPVYTWYCDKCAPSGSTPISSLSDGKTACARCKKKGHARGYQRA